MTIFITRPHEDALPLAQKLKSKGWETVISPVLEIVPRANVTLPETRFQALCVTSANGVRCLSGAIPTQTPVFAVGKQSAQAARLRGFEHVSAQGGDVHGLVAYIQGHLKPQDGPLAYISGAEISSDLEGQLKSSGFAVQRLITYDAVAQRLNSALEVLRPGDCILLYSPRSAKLWAAEIQRLQLQSVAQKVTHYCLSAQVAAALPPQFPSKIATTPDEGALLALLDIDGEGE